MQFTSLSGNMLTMLNSEKLDVLLHSSWKMKIYINLSKSETETVACCVSFTQYH